MRKNSVAIASVLKPVKDPRAYFRFGISLRETNKYEINIIGFSTKKEQADGDIHFQTLFSGARTDFRRILVPWHFFRKILKIRPEVLIVTTPELLPIAVIAKWMLKYKLIYDIQENHVLNISQNRTSRGLSKWLAGAIIKSFESGSRPFIEHFFLAERCYLDELPTFKPATVLENKFFKPSALISPIQFAPERPLRFLISGTITEVYGILNGIQWFKEFRKYVPNSELYVIGYCPIEEYRARIENEIPSDGISLNISDSPVPYDQILDAYADSDIVLMPYWQIDSIRTKVPSKLYESLSLGKVCLFSPNSSWEEIAAPYDTGFSVDFQDYSGIPNVVSQLFSRRFFSRTPDISLTWKSQEAEFLDVIASLVR